MPSLPPPLGALATWIGKPTLDGDQRAEAVLAAASNLVEGYTGRDWSTIDDAPEGVIDLVVQVAARVYLSPPNPNVRNWAGGPFSEGYFDAAQNGLYLTSEERSQLDRYRTSVGGIGTITTTRNDRGCDTIYVPTAPAPSGYPFPWYSADGMW